MSTPGSAKGESRGGKGNGCNWDRMRPEEARWVLRTEIGELGGTQHRRMDKGTLRKSGGTGRRGRTHRP